MSGAPHEFLFARSFLIACLLGLVVTPTKAGEVLCGDEWVRFRPLSAEPFGQKLGDNTYMVRKDHILRGSIAAEGPLSLFGYVRIKPMEGDARKNGEFRVSKEDLSGDPSVPARAEADRIDALTHRIRSIAALGFNGRASSSGKQCYALRVRVRSPCNS